LLRPSFHRTFGNPGSCHSADGSGNLSAIEIDIPDDIAVLEESLQGNWQEDLKYTQAVGTDFVSNNQYAVLKVPSVVMPKAANYLLNTGHFGSARIAIIASYRYPFDSRLLR
jgi:RES domain-containing protein